MMFTAIYGFVGVGVVSLAVSEVLETIGEIKAAIQQKKMEEIAALLAKANAMTSGLGAEKVEAGPKKPSLLSRYRKWTKTNALTRVLRVIVPLGFIAVLGALLLVVTEEDDSDIMLTADPFLTGLYVSIITGISTGYGDFYPTTVS
jgi:hypothetical protein